MKNEIVFQSGYCLVLFFYRLKKAGLICPAFANHFLPQESRHSQHKIPCVSCVPWFNHYFRK